MAELSTLIRHSQANVIKLRSLLRLSIIGDKIDYEKLKYFDEKMMVVDFQKIYFLSDNLAQSLLRMALFKRNNDLEVDSAILFIFDLGDRLSNEQAREVIINLKKRMIITILMAYVIRKQLRIYIQNPVKYDDVGIHWNRSLWRKTRKDDRN